MDNYDVSVWLLGSTEYQNLLIYLGPKTIFFTVLGDGGDTVT